MEAGLSRRWLLSAQGRPKTAPKYYISPARQRQAQIRKKAGKMEIFLYKERSILYNKRWLHQKDAACAGSAAAMERRRPAVNLSRIG